jgi:hypothetical protein
MLDLPMNGLTGIMPYRLAEGRMPLRAAPRFLLIVHKHLTILPRERSIFLFEFPYSKALTPFSQYLILQHRSSLLTISRAVY